MDLSLKALEEAVGIRRQIEELEQRLRSLFGGNAPSRSTQASAVADAPATGGAKRRKLSAAARGRIAAAQRARWAKARGESAPATNSAVKSARKKGGLTPAGRRRLAEAMRARWAARKRGAPAPNARK